MFPTISVIIPTYNRATKVVRAVASVLDQTYQNFEIIVVDDGSEDNTQEVLAHFTSNEGLRFTVIRHNENRGVSAARNTGIAQARGEFVAFLDDDDIFKPEKLALQHAFMKANPSYAMSITGFDYFLEGHYTTFSSAHWKNPQHAAIFNSGCTPSTWMVRRNIFSIIGNFDTKITNWEDGEWCIRFLEKFRLGSLPGLLMRYGGSHYLERSNELDDMRYILEKHKKCFQDQPDYRKLFLSVMLWRVARDDLFARHDLAGGGWKIAQAFRCAPLDTIKRAGLFVARRLRYGITRKDLLQPRQEASKEVLIP